MNAFDIFKQEFGVESEEEVALAKLACNWTLDQLEGLAKEFQHNSEHASQDNFIQGECNGIRYCADQLKARIKELRT